MRLCLIIVFAVFTLTTFSQRKILSGQVTDQSERNGLPSVHVRNISAQKITVADGDGFFRITAAPTDTLLLTSVGYQAMSLVLTIESFWELLKIPMIESPIELDEVQVSSIPSIEQFKEQVQEYQPKDSVEFWYFGVAPPVFKGEPMLDGQHKKLLYAVFNPTSFIHYSVSKKEKEKRKYHKLMKTQEVSVRANKKFTRDWVQKQTALEGDKLTSFIAFCDFDMYYLDKTPLFIIREDMMAKLDAYLAQDKN